jgi:hypothetical protein
MTTPFYSDKCTVGAGIQSRAGLSLEAVVGVYEIAAALLTADVIHMVKIPKGATLVDVILAVDDLEADAGDELTLSVGYTGALEAIISQDTVGQAGGVARASVIGFLGKKFTAEDTIQVSATAGAETGNTTGTITLVALYTMDP